MPEHPLPAQTLEDALRLDWLDGAVSVVATGYSTGWRRFAFGVVAQWLAPTRLEIEGAEPRVVGARGLLLIPGGVRHCVTVLRGGTPCCRWAHVHCSALGAPELFAAIATRMDLPPAVGEPIGDACAELAEAQGGGSGLAALARRKAARARLLALLAALAPEAASAMPDDARLLPVLRHLHERYAEPIGRDLLARRAGLSPSRFHTVFARALGVPPLTYLRRVRMQHARALLAASDLAVAAVGARVGYPDPYHFSRQFRLECGMSPRAHRRRAREAWFARVPPAR